MGSWIVFEGGEGTGKSTVIKWLEQELRKKGATAIVTREPGGTVLAEELRKSLVTQHPQAGAEEWTPLSEFLIFAASRAQHFVWKIQEALKQGNWVLCDRFMDSSWVYQGFVRGVPTDFIDDVHARILNGVKPDLIVIFDLDPEIGLRRADGRSTAKQESKIEKRGTEFHTKVRQGYLTLAKRGELKRIVIDASLPVDQVQENVWKTIKDHFFK